jgi:hypothetical protein
MSPKVLAAFCLTTLSLVGSLDARQASSTASPPDGRILGVVVDEGDKPVAGAVVYLSDGRETETDEHGRFTFVRVRPGTHEIAAVTSSCAIASGGFDVRSGTDALLQLIVQAPAADSAEQRSRSRGSPTRRLEEAELMAMGDRSALEALDQFASHIFQTSGSRLALRARTGSMRTDLVEPLLIVDGARMNGHVAEALRVIRAADLTSMEVYVGAAAGWEFQSGGAPAVVEVTTRMKPRHDPLENPEMCLRPKAR